MGFAFYPDDSAKLRDALNKQFPNHFVEVKPERTVGAQFLTFAIRDSNTSPHHIAYNVLEAALHLDSCVISGGLYVVSGNQNLGIGQRMMRAKIEWANKQHYTLLATIRDHNEVQKHILTKFGWQYVGADLWAYMPIKE